MARSSRGNIIMLAADMGGSDVDSWTAIAAASGALVVGMILARCLGCSRASEGFVARGRVLVRPGCPRLLALRPDGHFEWYSTAHLRDLANRDPSSYNALMTGSRVLMSLVASNRGVGNVVTLRRNSTSWGGDRKPLRPGSV